MKAQDLKNSILQLAIQGKLVEQREEEGTAKELIEQIQAEKEKLIKEKKIKKEKPLPEITEDEIPFDIPESWEWVRLSEIIDVRDGTHDTPKYVEMGIPLVTSKNLKEGNIDFDNVKLISLEDAEKINMRSGVDNGDILFAMIGSIGNPVLVKKIREFSIKNMALLKPIKNSLFNMEYLLKFLQFEQEVMKKKAAGGVQSFVSLTFLRQYLIPIPPVEEQKRIVEKIEELMPYVEKYDKAYTEVEELNKKFPEDMQKSILQYAIQGKLVEQREEDETAEELYQKIQAEKEKLIKEGKIKKTKPLPAITEEEIPFYIPQSWKWVRFGEIVNFNMGKTPPRSELKYWNEAYNWISIADMIPNGYILETKEKISEGALKEKFNMSLVPKGTLLMSFKLTVGRVSILDIDAVHNEAIISIYPYADLDKLIRNYLFTMLPLLSTYGDTKGAIKGKTLNSTSLNNLLIPLPPLDEQKRIVEKIEEILPYTKQLIKKINM